MTFAFKYMDEDVENTGNGQKSMVKAFLSLEIWQPLGKLTYVMYLLHVIVYLWLVGDLETPTYYTEWNEWLVVIGIWFVTALIGLVLWFVVEKPTHNIVSLVMERIMRWRTKKAKDGHLKLMKNEEPLLLEEGSLKLKDLNLSMPYSMEAAAGHVKAAPTGDIPVRELSPDFASKKLTASNGNMTVQVAENNQDSIDPNKDSLSPAIAKGRE